MKNEGEFMSNILEKNLLGHTVDIGKGRGEIRFIWMLGDYPWAYVSLITTSSKTTGQLVKVPLEECRILD